MRLLHTSDWHLGQTLHDFDRGYEHQEFLDWLLQCLGEQQIDALLIAGDVFDNANPSAVAQRQFYQFLQHAKAQYPYLNIVLIAGNHDSAARIDAPAPVLAALGVNVIGQVPRLANGEIDVTQLVIPLTQHDGSVGAWVLAIPFLRPSDVPMVETEGDAAAHAGFQAGVAKLYQMAYAQAVLQRQPGEAIIAMGHCHMTGGEISQDSERNIVLGGTDALPAAMFDTQLAYVALGHLHKAQRVAKTEHIRYCGSPLPMSFAEMDYRHQVLRVDLVGEKLHSVHEVRVPRSVELLRVPRQPAPLPEVLEQLAALTLETQPSAQQAYLQVRILQQGPESGLRSRIETALEGKPVRLAKIETVSQQAGGAEYQAITMDDLQQLQPGDIFSRLYQQRYGVAVPDNLRAAFEQLQQQVAHEAS